MKHVWIASDNIISPLGFTAGENFQNVIAGKTGLSLLTDPRRTASPVYAGAIAESEPISEQKTKFERLCIRSAKDALRPLTLDASSDRTIFILSTTKGNVELLDAGITDTRRLHLYNTAVNIAAQFGNRQQPVVISNACISGVMALLAGKRLLQTGRYDHAVVIGADMLTRFVLSGFQSLQAISPERCQPFDAKRKGVNLGEAAATIVLSVDPPSIGGEQRIKITGGGLSNDANHISGPSRTGEELASAIGNAVREAGIAKQAIDFISAHGTATRYNDEMEAKAFTIAELAHTPLNSLKGYFGHTLGAAGIVETIISKYALQENSLVPTAGFDELGVTTPISVIRTLEKRNALSACLKTASGFGGCNAAMVLQKVI